MRRTCCPPDRHRREGRSPSRQAATNEWLCLLESELQHTRVVRVAHLSIVEHRHAERVLLLEILELDVELAGGGELSRDDDRPHAVLPGVLGRDVTAIPSEGR